MSQQVSAYISNSTRKLLSDYVKQHGVKKGFLLEEALLHHLQALREIPQDVQIPARIRLDRQGMEQLANLLETPPTPVDALRDLMND